MCLIILKPKHIKMPKKSYIIEADRINDDGIGIALLKYHTEKIRIKKDFKNVKTFITWAYKNVKKEDLAIIHFRRATHGLKDEGNRHPFPISKNATLLRQKNLLCNMAVAHNGVLSQYNSDVKYSDTQKFVMDILSDENIKNNLKNPAIVKLLLNFLNGDKLSIMDNKGRFYMFGDFIREKGLFYSNKSYVPLKIINNDINDYGTIYKVNKVDREHSRGKEFLSTPNPSTFRDTCEKCKKELYVKYYYCELETYQFCKSCAEKFAKELDNKKTTKKRCTSCDSLVDVEDFVIFNGQEVCTTCRTMLLGAY